MTAMNVVKSRDRITVITDGASYDDSGTLLAVCSKVSLLPNYPGFIMQSGGTAWTPAIVAMAGFVAKDTDELFDEIECLLPQVLEEFSGMSSSPMGRVLFGGWSNSRGCMRLGVVFTDFAAGLNQPNKGSGEVIAPEAFVLQELDGDQLLCQPPIGARAWIEGYGSQISAIDQIRDFDELAAFMLAAQRTVGVPHRGVGGFGQITTITKDAVSARVFERYEDEIGEIMQPQSVDWAAWRSARGRGLSPATVDAIPQSSSVVRLSRHERRAAEARARKTK